MRGRANCRVLPPQRAQQQPASSCSLTIQRLRRRSPLNWHRTRESSMRASAQAPSALNARPAARLGAKPGSRRPLVRCQASPDEQSIANKVAVALTAVSASWVSGWPGAGARGYARRPAAALVSSQLARCMRHQAAHVPPIPCALQALGTGAPALATDAPAAPTRPAAELQAEVEKRNADALNK